MSHDNIRPSAQFNDEDSNHSGNPAFDDVLATRLSRRGLLRGGMGVAGAAALGGAASRAGCATAAPEAVSGPMTDSRRATRCRRVRVWYGRSSVPRLLAALRARDEVILLFSMN